MWTRREMLILGLYWPLRWQQECLFCSGRRLGKYEKMLIQQYLSKQRATNISPTDSLYYIPLKRGDGRHCKMAIR